MPPSLARITELRGPEYTQWWSTEKKNTFESDHQSCLGIMKYAQCRFDHFSKHLVRGLLQFLL